MHVSIERILELQFLPIIDFDTVHNFEALIETLLEQKVPVLQINVRGSHLQEHGVLLADLVQKYKEISLGVGFLYNVQEAEGIIKQGVHFTVSSVLAKELLVVAELYQVPAILSGFTPTEIYEAYQTKSDLIQIFPASQLHHKSVVSLLEHLPKANFILTGGLTISTALEFLRYGAKAVGLKGALFSKQDLAEENYASIGLSLKNFKNRVKHND